MMQLSPHEVTCRTQTVSTSDVPQAVTVTPVSGPAVVMDAVPTVSVASVEEAVGAINWILAPDSSERAPLDRWCAGVGPAVSAPIAAADSTVSGSLVVISWNTHVGGGDIPGLVSDLRAGKFTEGAPVEHFVLLLQEVHRADAAIPLHIGAIRPRRIEGIPHSGQRADIIETASNLGLHLYYVPSMANGVPVVAGVPEDRGNAILSSLPLRDLTAIELPYEGQRRVAAAATVSGITTSGEPWELRVVNVHLDNRSRTERLLNSLGAGRTRQARALLDVLGTDTNAPTVLGGDLNTWFLGFMERADDVLRKRFPLPHKEILEPTLAIKNGFGKMRVDRLMFDLPSTLTAETRRLDDPRGSDHYPLIGWIRFPDATVTENPAPAAPPRS